MAASSISFGSPHVRPMGVHRACGEPDGIKENTHPTNITVFFVFFFRLFGEQDMVMWEGERGKRKSSTVVHSATKAGTVSFRIEKIGFSHPKVRSFLKKIRTFGRECNSALWLRRAYWGHTCGAYTTSFAGPFLLQLQWSQPKRELLIPSQKFLSFSKASNFRMATFLSFPFRWKRNRSRFGCERCTCGGSERHRVGRRSQKGLNERLLQIPSCSCTSEVSMNRIESN